MSKGNWVFERSSGFAGYRCQTCATWIYANRSPRHCACDEPKEKLVFNYIAHIRRNSTGEVVQFKDEWILGVGPCVHQWESGNYSCDCNRQRFFRRAKNQEGGVVKCSADRYSVNLEDAETHEIFHKEFEP